MTPITNGSFGDFRSLRTSSMKCFMLDSYSSCPPYWSFQPWNHTKPATSSVFPFKAGNIVP